MTKNGSCDEMERFVIDGKISISVSTNAIGSILYLWQNGEIVGGVSVFTHPDGALITIRGASLKRRD